MRLDKNVLIVFLLLSVFAVGTLNFVDTVEAVKWKKYDSGKFTDCYPAAGYKNILSYQSYIKGNNELYVKLYSYSKATGNKKLYAKYSFSKKNGIIKIVADDYSWNQKYTDQSKTSFSVKTVYKKVMKEFIKIESIPPEKMAFDKQSFAVNKNTFKTYAIQEDNGISVYIYKNNEEYITLNIYKENNKIIYEEYNQKRKLTSKESLKPTQTFTAVYSTKINKIINKIKSS